MQCLVARDKPPLEECVYGGVELIGNPPCGLIWECDAQLSSDEGLIGKLARAEDMDVFRIARRLEQVVKTVGICQMGLLDFQTLE
jgi:hypothetical protein